MTKKLMAGLSILTVLLESIFLASVYYHDFRNIQTIASDSLQSNQAVTIRFGAGQKVPSASDLFRQYPDTAFFYKVSNTPELCLWGICGSFDLDRKARALIDGDFFLRKDFFQGENKAVVGKNILNSNYCLKVPNGKRYFVFQNRSYKIIGVLSSNLSNMLDNTVYVNLDSFKINFRQIVIDGSESQKVVGDLQKRFALDIIKEEDAHFIERYLLNGTDESILNILEVVLMAVLQILIPIIILRYDREEIAAERIVGIPFRSTLLRVLKAMSFGIMIGTFLALAGYAFLYNMVLKALWLEVHFFLFSVFFIFLMAVNCIITWLSLLLSNHLFYRTGVR